MDFFYDGQIRRYITQFMRIFIGFKYQAGDGEQRHIPVMYGDMTRQVAGIIADNSENKMPTVPRMACYITGLELDKSMLSDPTFVSKVQIREREWEVVNNQRVYGPNQGIGYTVERLMPTPFKLTIRTDIWTSNTDQKLQLLEQILVLFNPSLDVQTTDNYVDWTSLTSVYLNSVTFSSRAIPQGVDTSIDIATLDFEMPIWITPPAKVKKLGIVRAIVNNMFANTGDAEQINDLIYNDADISETVEYKRYGIVVLKADNGVIGDYNISIVDVGQAIIEEGIDQIPERVGSRLDWNLVLDQYGNYKAGVSRITLRQPNKNLIVGTIAINPVDPTFLIASLDMDTVPSNTELEIGYYINGTEYTSLRTNSKGTIDAIVNPYNFNPLNTYASQSNYPVGLRYLMLDDVNDYLAPKAAPSISTNIIETDFDFYRIVRPDQTQPAGMSNIPVSYRNVYQTRVFVNGISVTFKEIEDAPASSIFQAGVPNYDTAPEIFANQFVVGRTYKITVVGTTDWYDIGVNISLHPTITPGIMFTCTKVGSGTGKAKGYVRITSGKYKIMLDEFPPLTDVNGDPSSVTYVIEKYAYPDYYNWQLDDPNTPVNEGDDPDTIMVESQYDLSKGGPERQAGVKAWQNLDGSSTYIKANSIVEWSGTEWIPVFDPDVNPSNTYITNLRTGIQYKWDGVQWLKSFEGEYVSGTWYLTMNP